MTIHTLDLHFQDTPGLIAAYLIESQGQLALIETGPGATLSALQQAIRQRGFDPQAIRHVFVTHIHLDHAGGAGWWAQQGAQVYCHPKAVPHLLDPSRLMESAQRVYGDAMDRLWGTMLPAPTERVTSLQDEQSVKVGAIKITAWDTPGHAKHHHAFICGDVCFTGDVAGLRLNHSDYLSVTAAPPQFEPPAYESSIQRLLAAGFRSLFLTHFGEVTDVHHHLLKYLERISEVHLQVREWHNQKADADTIRLRYRTAECALATQLGVTDAEWQLHEMANASAMCADGIRLYVEKHP